MGGAGTQKFAVENTISMKAMFRTLAVIPDHGVAVSGIQWYSLW